jgi:hypothetical protein
MPARAASVIPFYKHGENARTESIYSKEYANEPPPIDKDLAALETWLQQKLEPVGLPLSNQGTSMPEPTSELIDAKIEASEARGETKIARIEGKLDLVLSKLTNVAATLGTTEARVREDNRSTRNNQWIVGGSLALLIVALAALAVGVLAIFPSVFGIGTQMREMLDRAIESHQIPHQ